MTMFSALNGLKKDLCALLFVGGISSWPKMRILLCATDTKSGGAYQAVRIAKSASKTIINLADS